MHVHFELVQRKDLSNEQVYTSI